LGKEKGLPFTKHMPDTRLDLAEIHTSDFKNSSVLHSIFKEIKRKISCV
jgi:hypothetical protein